MVNFWDRKDSSYTLDADVKEDEDVFEDSRSELHAEESKSDDKEGEKEEEGEKKEVVGEKKVEEREKGMIISEERLNNITNEALVNELWRRRNEDAVKVYGLFNSTSKGQQASPNVKKKMRRSVPANLSSTFPMRASPRRRCQLRTLSPSESPAFLVKERFPFKVEVCVTRLQEKMAMEEVKEERKRVPQFGLISPNISRRARGVKRSFKSEGLDVRRRQKMRIVE